jgi:sodium/pantothenate symporter
VSETSTVTIVTFVIYIMAVFVLAGFSHKLLSKKSFLSEYFLGSRGLGTWALAFTFAATSSSGGSFTGYPSLIYSHGWILALWIASYMIFPLTTMGVLGKRINQAARKTGAITIPDVFRDRYESAPLGIFASCTIIFFTVCNLVAQFKAGALILEEVFNFPSSWGYPAALVLFSFTVIFYTAYGGFRAVVWTDVMQGIVMGVGVMILVPVVLYQAGGLNNVQNALRAQPPTAITSMPGPYNDLVLRATGGPHPGAIRYVAPDTPSTELRVEGPLSMDDADDLIEVHLETDASGNVTTTANDVKAAIERHPDLAAILTIEFPFDNDEIVADSDGRSVSRGATGIINLSAGERSQEFVFLRGDEALFGPGRRSNGDPFLPLGLAFSFFFVWAITGIGQPGTMVRLIAFRDSRTLKRSILTVTIYYALIYLPLVFVFVAARNLLPPLNAETSDKAMVLISTRVVADLGVGFQILGAIFVAAPFAAVMSTVDSFLLMISSGLVRDIYQRSINPQVSPRTVKRLSYATTTIAGILVMALAASPPDFLQRIIVFTSSGFASTYLFPMLLGLYWKGMTRQGALASMVGGFSIIVLLFSPNLAGGSRIYLFGMDPVIFGLSGSLLLAILVSKITGPAPTHLVRRYFQKS